MTARVGVEADWMRQGVNIHMSPGPGQVYLFEPIVVRTFDPERGTREDAQPLFLPEHVARALYEELADHFGHSGHDTRALRRDYDAERKRVDTFIAHLTGGAS